MTGRKWNPDPTTPAAKARRKEYDSAAYRRTRARYKKLVDAGEASCWRCGRWIAPGSDWHVGHDDHDRRIIRGPEHARENLSAAAVKANKSRRPKPPPPPVCRVHLAVGNSTCGGIHSEAW